ncbi:MAG: arginine--tRNA ligase [Verrucomicrobiales bacterium]
MTTFALQLTKALKAALNKTVSDVPPDVAFEVTPATDTRFGDYQSNAAMLLAKRLGRNPRELAAEIIAALDVGEVSAPPNVAGPGFINFRINPEPLARRLEAMLDDQRLGVPEVPRRRLVIDFSSPNVAKPMHVGHIRSTILGDAIARIARFLGHHVVADNHIGDWGTQFGMLLVGWKSALDRAALEADPLGELERLYKLVNERCKEDPAVRERAKEELVKLQQGDAGNLERWREMTRLSQQQFDTIYRRLDIHFDYAHGESFYNPWLDEVAQDLLERGIARDSEGALCVFSDGSTPEKDDPFLIQRDGKWHGNPALVRKADGGFNYTTTDLATVRHRMREFAPDQILYVTDGRQQLHFRQLFAIFRRWEPQAKVDLIHVWFGSILGDDGKPFKTRSGETIKLTELLDEAEERAFQLVTQKNPAVDEADRREIARAVGLGAIKYADLLPNRQSDYVFSWDRMLSLQGNTAPYLQNAYVRTRSIFRKFEGAPIDLTGPFGITEDAERALALKLAQFGEVIPNVLNDFRPNILANYLYEVATTFHSFYEACPVLRAEEAVRKSRLALCELTSRILGQGLNLLGICAVEKM